MRKNDWQPDNSAIPIERLTFTLTNAGMQDEFIDEMAVSNGFDRVREAWSAVIDRNVRKQVKLVPGLPRRIIPLSSEVGNTPGEWKFEVEYIPLTALAQNYGAETYGEYMKQRDIYLNIDAGV